MQRYAAGVYRASMRKRSTLLNTTARRRMQQETNRTIRFAVANEASSLRLMSVISGFEESLVRGWDCGDDDGG